MKYKSIIHCCNPKLQDYTIKLAKKMKLSVKICRYNPNGIIINGTKRKHNAFCAILDNNPDYGIFYDHKHPQNDFYVFKPHYRLGNDVDTNRVSILPSTPALDEYGRTPNWYSQAYNAQIQTEEAPTIAIISLGNHYHPKDLKSYWKNVCGYSEDQMPKVIDVLAGNKKKQRYTGYGVACLNTLQLEIIGGICPRATLLFISAPNTVTGLYQAFSTAIYGAKVKKVTYQPSIVLCSWGTSEIEMDPIIMNAFNNLFQTGLSRKITLVVAAGDNGSDDGYKNNGVPNVSFPASSPYVISVGGTTLLPDGTETAWAWNPIFRWGTGGGISNYFPMPDWQEGLVADTIEKRRVPDISFNADPNYGYTIFIDNKLLLNGIGGTSCSASLFTGFLGSMNLSYPKSALESLYTLYHQENPCFNDIVVGTNDNINSKLTWQAHTGFDLCTGMGSANIGNLFQALKL